jgi:cytochrome c oxidase cbb3-type subunit II
MKNGPIFFLGLLAAVAISWAGIVLGSHAQLGSLPPYFDQAQGQIFPREPGGIAARGQLVYADLGCAACHTQQVLRPNFGSDQARGWGDRQSVARDYIHQFRPQLGASRFGPDLATFGTRVEQTENPAAALHTFLYAGSATHPRYRFLYEEEPIVGQRSLWALNLVGPDAPPPGLQVVPSERARSLVSYMLTLKMPYDYPEAVPVAPTAPPPGAAAPPPAKIPVTPTPAAAPDERKTQETKQ